MYNVDANDNVILVNVYDNRYVARLLDNPSRGYVGHVEEGGCFGDDECPSSYCMPCDSWFGEGERFANAFDALTATE